ncbi:MAG: aminopeptidase [Candidatus Hermodarchaeota archaeon]
MSSEFEENLEKYAEVIVKIGLNLQPGQRLLIGGPTSYNYGTPIELAPLVRLITKKAYRIGARLVEVFWDDEQIRKIRFENAPKDSFEEYPIWRLDCQYQFGKGGDAVLLFGAYNPDLLKDQDEKAMLTAYNTYAKHRKTFGDLISKSAVNWTAITAPVEGWAEKVFFDVPKEDQKKKFWDTIFEICRIKNGDPIVAWENHIKQLIVRSNYLNQKQYDSLKLEAPGTDLTIGLPKSHIWGSARFKTQSGIEFVGNIPTEEVFTTTHKDRTEGVVTSTKPRHTDVIIDGMSLTFSKGRVIEASAKKGEEMLNKLLETDEGARRLGEIALVPHSSPISQSELLYYNTLIDENASSHIAIGRGFQFALKNGRNMSEEEFSKAGGNLSKTHIDFMIGSEKINVYGITKNGKIEPIMRNGEWAFEL